MVTLPAEAFPADVQQAVEEHEHSRHVTTDTVGALTGALHMKDVMDIDEDRFHDPVPAKRVRRLIATPGDLEFEDGLARLRQHGSHVARTVDADGNTLGLLFLEDVLELLVGEVNDTTAT